jgi:hypothetical protein
MAEAGYVGRVDGRVEARVFYGRSYDGAYGSGVGGAGDYIDIRSADDEVEREGRRERDGKHLALTRRDPQVRQVG